MVHSLCHNLNRALLKKTKGCVSAYWKCGMPGPMVENYQVRSWFFRADPQDGWNHQHPHDQPICPVWVPYYVIRLYRYVFWGRPLGTIFRGTFNVVHRTTMAQPTVPRPCFEPSTFTFQGPQFQPDITRVTRDSYAQQIPTMGIAYISWYRMQNDGDCLRIMTQHESDHYVV